MGTKAQEWAKRRNFAKYRLKGMLKSLDGVQCSPALTRLERSYVGDMCRILSDLLERWEERNTRSHESFLEEE